MREGGGATYVVEFARELKRGGGRGLQWEFSARQPLAARLQETGARVAVLDAGSGARQAVADQLSLARADGRVLVAAANFGPLARREPFVLVAHNRLHFVTAPFRGDGRVRLWLESRLARASARRAAVVVTPSATMSEAVRRFTDRQVCSLPLGPGSALGQTSSSDGRVRFAHRTGWGPHKRLADLLEAVRLLALRAPDSFVLRTACDPTTAFARGFCVSELERTLLADPLVRRHLEIAPFGPESDESTRVVGDVVVMTSLEESFCFPLAEAVALRLPVVTVDRPYAREMCGSAAVYVPACDPAALADAMGAIIDGHLPPAASDDLRARLSWRQHVDGLAAICRGVCMTSDAAAGG